MKIKYLGMMFLASFIGIMVNPEFLAASDSVAILDLEQSNVVETVIEKSVAKTETKVMPAAPKAGVAKVVAPVAVNNQVKFAWGTQNLVLTDNTSVDAGVNVMKSGRLMWAHNNTAFNNIKNLKIGDTFSVTIDGVTKNYKVAANPIDGKAGVAAKVIDVNRGELYHERIGNFFMVALKNGWTHDLVLMTCAGVGNAHRYVVVADEI